jgi:tRNA U38,U39,U40 pseudouridine synthase TruA
MKPINETTVREFCEHMEQSLDTRILDPNSPFIRLIGMVLELIGVDAVEKVIDAWLARWSISLRKFIYVPFNPGVATTRFPLWLQVEVLSHEFTHAYWQQRMRRWFSKYIGRQSFRAAEEIKAFKTQMEVAHAFGRTLEASRCVEILKKSYLLNNLNLYITNRHLKKYQRYVKKGYISQPVTKIVADFWGF